MKRIIVLMASFCASVLLLATACSDQNSLDATKTTELEDGGQPLAIVIVPWTGTVQIGRSAKYRLKMPDDGPEIDIDNGISRDGNTFFKFGTAYDSTTACTPNCDACHFKFGIEFDIEAAEGGNYYPDTNDAFFDAWHGDNQQDKITWEYSGGTNSGWFNGNDPNNFGHTSIARFQIDEMVECGEETEVTVKASSDTGLVTPVSVTIVLKCDECD